MKQGFRQSMAWLHTWTGLTVGWVLLLIFMGGTASYYRDEISRWMRPELPLAAAAVPLPAAADRAQAFLGEKAAKATQWSITLPTDRNPAINTFWRIPQPPAQDGQAQPQRRRRGGNAVLDAATGSEVKARETRGGDFFYRLHFDLHYIPALWARWIVGFCAMFMLVAIFTGIVTHKKIFKDFFTFRPGKGQRSWLDFHNVSAVMALPYHIMITYTGIVTLMFMYLPWGVQAAYPGDDHPFYHELSGEMDDARPAAGTPAPLVSLGQVVGDAMARWDGQAVAGLTVFNPGDAAAVIDVRQTQDISIEAPVLRYDGVSGALVGASGEPMAASQTRGVLYGLHMARFASEGLRLLFFASGLLGCLMVASGVVLWAVKERPKHQKTGRIGFGLRLVDSLNIGAVAGLPIAFAAFFWANRLLPVGLEQRQTWEMNIFFYAWGAALLAAFVWPKRLMWSWQLYLGGALFAAIPLLNAATTDIHLGASLAAGDWAMAGVDIVCALIGICVAYCGWRMQIWRPQMTAAQRRVQGPVQLGGAT